LGNAVPVANNVVSQVWKYRDTAGAILTGMTFPADIELVLKKATAGGSVTASEVVSWTESADPGYYDIKYTPLGGTVYTLFLKELNPASDGRQWWFVSEVMAAGAVYAPAFANAYCAETDVERFTQLAFTATSKPTSQEVAAWAQARSSEMSLQFLAQSGWTVTPATVVSGSLEQDVLRDMAAIGAGADAMLAKFMDSDPVATQKAEVMLAEYKTRLDRMTDYATKNLGSLSVRTHISSGEVTPKDETTITDGGLALGISMDQEF
jgi:hypothetical protein